jgi:hypothetical protein
MCNAQRPAMKKFLIVGSIIGAIILFGIWYRRSDPAVPTGPTKQNNLIEDVNK